MGILEYVVVVLCIGIVTIWSWNRRHRGTKWEINLQRVTCPRCQNPLPRVRIPRTREQAKWGGWTCKKCGCEVDKHGKEIAAKGEFRAQSSPS